MKICSIQAVIAMTFCSLAFAHNNYGQVLDKKITVTFKDVSIEQALETIEHLTNVKFFYSLDQLNVKDKISLKAISMPLGQVLDQLLSPYHIKYKVHEKKSTVTLKRESPDTGSIDVNDNRESPGDNALPPSAETISGKVTDAATHQPMAGVNVIIKGTTVGTTTDANGMYVIRGADTNSVLVFSFIGYITHELPVLGRLVIDVELQGDVKSLEEVEINAGYWQVKEKEQTGNIVRITSEEIGNQPVPNVLQALAGRMTGVYVQQNTGVAGGAIKIQIRGQNSLRNTDNDNGNLPLYIIDGVPFASTSLGQGTITSPIGSGNSLSSINPADIETIEILKDADATAIYGSRGANGVVLITTKRAKTGKTTVDVNVSTGIGKVTNTLDLLNTRQYLDMRYEAFKNDNVQLTSTTPNAYDLTLWDTTRYTNWQKELIGGTANVINGQISLSGGEANTQFLVTGAYYGETTVFPGDFGYAKGSAHFNLNHTSIDKKFNASFTSYFANEENDLVREDFTRTSLVLPPDAPALYMENGELNWENGSWSNPLAATLSKYRNNTDNLITSARLAYKLNPQLTLISNLGYNSMNMRQLATLPIKSNRPGSGITTGSAQFSNGYNKSWIAEPQLEFKRQVSRGYLTALVGGTFQQDKTERTTMYAAGFISDALLEDLKSATQIQLSSSNYSLYRYNAAFGRINYVWQEKYVINLTGRRDGSSRFGPGKQFANFGAVGAAWIFSNESFMEKNPSFISSGKLRASYGITGSDQIGNYGYLDASASTRYPYNGEAGLVPVRLANPEYAWETNKKVEAGLDMGFLNDKLSVNASWYRNRSSNQLIGFPLPGTAGFSSIQYNLPATVQNTGWEFVLAATIIHSNELQWKADINMTLPKSKLIEYQDIENSPYATIYSVGKPLNIIYAYRYTEVDPETGAYTFQDIDSDETLSPSTDRQFRKTIGPDYYGGIQNSVAFKGFELNIFLQFVKQQGRNYLYGSFGIPGSPGNQPVGVMARWQSPGDVSTVQRFTRGSGDASTAYSNTASYGDNTITDASFIRFKNFSLSYTFPSAFLKKAAIRKASVYLQGQNVFTFTDYDGLDPENQTTSSLPPLKMLTAGLQITL